MFEELTGSEAAGALAAVVPAELEDADLIEVMRAWERLAGWAAAGQLAAIAELARRRPRDHAEHGPTRADRGDARVPQVSEFAVDEVAAGLRLTRLSAGVRVQLAVELASRLAGTAAALRAGRIDLPRARVLAEAVGCLDDELAAAVEARVLPRAESLTSGQLRASAATAVLAADPAAAERRHRRAVADRAVTLRPLPDGMAGLWALLPADAGTALYTRLDDLARRTPAGDPRSMDARRADALLTLTLTNPTTPTPTPTPTSAAPAVTGTAVTGAGTAGSAAASMADSVSPGVAAGIAGGGAAGLPPAGTAAAVTGAGTAGSGPGAALTGAGPVPAGVEAGPAPAGVGAGPALAGVGAGPVLAGVGAGPALAGVGAGPALVGVGAGPALVGVGAGPVLVGARVHLTLAAATALGMDDQPGQLAGHGPIPASMARRLAGHGHWRRLLTDPGTGTIIEVGRDRYTPAAALADLVRSRDRTCRFPGCRQPAHRCDLDHITAWPAGPTTADNLATLCRHHHRLKHQTRWTIHPGDHPGELTWTSPTGHHYTTTPTDPDPPPRPGAGSV